MSIQELVDDAELVQNYKEYKFATQVFNGAIGTIDGAIRKLESTTGFADHASVEELKEITEYKDKIGLVK